jgi:RNA polymerase sigma factor (sigma-70 family)
MHAWRFGPPRDPKAWIVRAARNRAIDVIPRERRGASLLPELANIGTVTDTIDAALAPAADRANQLAMMFAVCDPALTPETHVTLILRWLCGLSPKEIGQAFLVDTQTIDRRLHRGKARLRELGELVDVDLLPDLEERRGSVLQALYLLFNEGYHGSNPREPVRPFLCTDALRLTELLRDTPATAHPDVSALAALFCFDIARLPTRLDADGVFVPLEEQDRARWDRPLIERGLAHLAASATGDRMSRWHLEAGIACEHAVAPSVRGTAWGRIVAFYDLLMAQSPGPIVALNRALAMAERDGSRQASASSCRLRTKRSWRGIRSTGRPWPTSSVGPAGTARRGRATSVRWSFPGARPNEPHTGGAWTSSKLGSGASGFGRSCSSSWC